jgi:hypothetical protein
MKGSRNETEKHLKPALIQTNVSCLSANVANAGLSYEQTSYMKAKPKRPAQEAKPEEWRVRLRVVCLSPPKPEEHDAAFGMQDNSTTKEWIIHAGETQPNGNVLFQCECRVRRNPANGKPNFLGPFVHGGTADRFLYLSWRPKDWRPGGPEVPRWVCLRRMKVRLGSITWSQIREVVRNNSVLEKKVEGTGPSGPFGSPSVGGEGWTIKD